MTRVIVATAAVPAAGQEAFASLGPIKVLDGARDALDDAEVLIVRGERLHASDLQIARRLRVIARTGVGVDNIDIVAATRHRIPVVFAPVSSARPIAEGTLALILAATKRLGELAQVLRDDRWDQRYGLEGLDLHGSVLGIIGFGNIGREVGRLAAAFGMQVLVFDPHAERGSTGRQTFARFVPLQELAKRADVVTLHCPLTHETRGLVNADIIEQFKPGAILINAARGGVIAGDAVIIDALERGQLGAVGLDVFEEEPPHPANPLLSDPRVVCTPHSIGLTREWNRLVFSSLASDVRRVLDGQEPRHLANPAALTSPRQSTVTR